MTRLLLLLWIGTMGWGCEGDSPSAPEVKEPAIGDLTQIISLDSLRNLPEGTEMAVRTIFAGDQLEDLQVRFVGVVDDMMPPLSVIMLEASDPKLIALGGVASGMSGSPLIFNGRTAGALAYSLDFQTKPPYYFFATPIEDMIAGTPRPVAKPARWAGRQVVPLAAALVMAGGSSRLAQGLKQDRAGSLGFLDALTSAGIGEHSYPLVPGSPLAVGVVIGDEVNLAGVGTISYVAGDELIAFGHPMYGRGKVALPILGAHILAEVSGLDSPYKFFSLGTKVLGTIHSDTNVGIGGTLNQGPAMFEVVSHLLFPDGKELTLNHRVPTRGLPLSEQAWGSYQALFSPLLNRTDDAPGRSLRVHTRISFDGTPLQVDQSRLYALHHAGTAEIILQAASAYEEVYQECIGQDLYPLSPGRIELEAQLVDSLLTARISALEADSLVSVGDTLRGVVTLSVGTGSEQRIPVALAVPDSFVAGTYTLELMPAGDLSDEEEEEEEEDTIEKLLARLNQEDPWSSLGLRLSLVEQEVPEDAESEEGFVPVDELSTTTTQGLGWVLDGHREQTLRVAAKP